MKEITTVLTLQLTTIGELTDEETAEWLEVKEKRTKEWLEMLKKEAEADDLLLLKAQTFVRDTEESHGEES